MPISGMAWVGDVLYMTDMEKNYLLRYDTALQMITDTVVIHEQPFQHGLGRGISLDRG